MPFDQVIAKGARIQITLTREEVSRIRQDLKMTPMAATQHGPRLRRAPATAGSTPVAASRPDSSRIADGADLRTALSRAVLALGIAEARAALDQLELEHGGPAPLQRKRT